MREILFRGKRLKDGKWLYGSLLKTKLGKYQINGCNADCTVKEETVGQYTGVSDKFGNEIYEGDIVNVYCLKNWGGTFTTEVVPCEVVFRSGKFCYLYRKHSVKYAIDENNVEVVGNIYD